MASLNLKLNNGVLFPTVGLGCYYGTPGQFDKAACAQMVTDSLNAGYRNIDTAALYGTEESTGMAIRASKIPREELFVTTKLDQKGHFHVREAFEESLKTLDVGYIDLYLMHWPMAQDPKTGKILQPEQSPTYVETWKEMEKLLDTGKVRAIGVSNFSVQTLEVLLKEAKVVPAVNQVECHLYLPQADLHEYCKKNEIVLTAYSPLAPVKSGASPILSDPTVVRLAKKYGKPEGTIVLSWGVQRGNWSVIPKSATPSRIKANIDLVTLDDADFEALQKVHTEPGKLKHNGEFNDDKPWDKDHLTVGWTQEQLGWWPKN